MRGARRGGSGTGYSLTGLLVVRGAGRGGQGQASLTGLLIVRGTGREGFEAG